MISLTIEFNSYNDKCFIFYVLQPSLLYRFPRLISFPEIRNTISEYIIGMLLIVACQSYEFNHLLGRLAGQCLPEARHHAGYQRR